MLTVKHVTEFLENSIQVACETSSESKFVKQLWFTPLTQKYEIRWGATYWDKLDSEQFESLEEAVADYNCLSINFTL